MGVRNEVEEESSDVEEGSMAGGLRMRRRCAWTCDSVVVTGAKASAVIPDHLLVYQLNSCSAVKLFYRVR